MWLLIVALLSTASVATQECRCESSNEDFYSHRRLTHEIHADNAHFESVKIDSAGYYIVDRIRVVPPIECDYHKSLQDKMAKEKDEKNVHYHNIFSFETVNNVFSRAKGTVRGATQKEEIFDCDEHTVSTPPKHTGMPKDIEKFILHELEKPRYEMNEKNQLVKVTPVVKNLHTREDGTPYLVESELDCGSLPLPVRLNYRALPFHCRCPSNVNPDELPVECHTA